MINTTLCYIEQNGQYLMLHKQKKKADINNGKWVGVGGKFEEGENAIECVIREVKEETGLDLVEYEEIGLVKFVSDIYEDEDMYLFKGTKVNGRLLENPPEGELKWIDKEEILDLPTWEGDRFFLKAMLSERTNLNMTLRYEGEKLIECIDIVEDPEYRTSKLIQSKHLFSTRLGGVSEGIYETMNLGFNLGDEPERVACNWRRLFRYAGISTANVACGKQVHGNEVVIVDETFGGEPRFGFNTTEADGYVTDKRGVVLAIFTADCVPVLLEDTANGVIGAVHCGWRSTMADIEKNVIDKMVSLGAKPDCIKLAIGPSIGYCHFQVGEEVVDAAAKLLSTTTDELLNIGMCRRDYESADKAGENNKYYLDLQRVIAKRFIQLGVRADSIDNMDVCTMCDPDNLWSHRSTQGRRGSLISVISRS